MRRIPGIAGGPEAFGFDEGGDAEFGSVGFAKNNQPRRFHFLHGKTVGFRNVAVETPAAGVHRRAGDFHAQVFDQKRYA